MLYAKVKKEKAEQLKKRIEGLIDRDYPILKEEGFVLFPLKKRVDFVEIVERDVEKKRKRPKSLKDALQGKIPDGLMKKLVRSFDIIGDVVVIEIPPELERWEKEIAKAIKAVHPRIKTICKRAGIHTGIFRIRPVEVIWGDGTETIHREHGVLMKLDIAKVYFTPRLSYERKRIRDLVRDGEIIGYFFAGVGPFGLIIAKEKDVDIYAIEINPDAVEYLKENVKLNKLRGRIHVFAGDVRDVVPTLGKKYDRILMPLPKGAEHFLDLAFKYIKPKGVIHFYCFAPQEDLWRGERIVKEVAEKMGKRVKVIFKRVVRPFAPRIFQTVFDILVEG